MSSLLTAELDTTRFNEAMGELYDTLVGNGQDADAREIVRDESRRFIKQALRFTPPQSKPQGEQAVERELNSLFSGALEKTIDEIGSAHGLNSINAFIEGEGAYPINIQWDHIDPSGSRMKEYHAQYKNKKGRVPLSKPSGSRYLWRARVVVPVSAKAHYINKIKSHVGRLKASLCKLAGPLGVSVSTWVANHIPSPFAIGDLSGVNSGAFPVIVIGSRAPGIGLVRHAAAEALKVRTTAMIRRAALVVSGYNKDLARGMRLHARANRTGGTGGDYGESGATY